MNFSDFSQVLGNVPPTSQGWRIAHKNIKELLNDVGFLAGIVRNSKFSHTDHGLEITKMGLSRTCWGRPKFLDIPSKHAAAKPVACVRRSWRRQRYFPHIRPPSLVRWRPGLGSGRWGWCQGFCRSNVAWYTVCWLRLSWRPSYLWLNPYRCQQ